MAAKGTELNGTLLMAELKVLSEQFGKFDANKEVYISSGRRSFGSGGLGSGLGECLRAGQPSCGLGLGDALQFLEEDLAGAFWVC